MSASFDRVNYLTRPNKTIERKAVFETLVKLNAHMALKAYRYVGFGSMWFGDFVLAHRILGIAELWSIERSEHAERADFNRPFAGIKIKSGDCTKVLVETADEDWQKPTIAWLDYDGILEDAVVQDIENLAQKSAKGSVLLISVNARRHFYRKSEPGAPWSARSEVEEIVGAASIPADFARMEVNEKDFPRFIGECIHNLISRKVAASGRLAEGQHLRYLPLFNYLHDDGTPMVTVGGLLADDNLGEAISSVVAELEETAGGKVAKSQTRFDLIQLTLKEKLALDSFLPSQEANFPEIALNSGIKLEPAQIEQYRRCYRHFPVFTESSY